MEPNFIIPPGFIIRPKVAGYKPTERENDAIDYLFLEWDYGYSPEVFAGNLVNNLTLQTDITPSK